MPKKACSYPFQIGPATKRALMPCILSNHIYTKCDSPRVWCCWLQAVGLLNISSKLSRCSSLHIIIYCIISTNVDMSSMRILPNVIRVINCSCSA